MHQESLQNWNQRNRQESLQNWNQCKGRNQNQRKTHPVLGQHGSVLESWDVRMHHTNSFLCGTLFHVHAEISLGAYRKNNNPFSPTTVIHLYSCIFKRTIPNVSAFSPRLSQMENQAGCWSALRWRNSGRLSVSILTTQGLLRLQALPLHADRHRWMDETLSAMCLWDGPAAAAKSLQSCPTLCDPIDGSPPGSPVSGILQARTLEWLAISFSNASKWKVKVKSLSHVWLFTTPWTAAYQAPPPMGFSRQEYWSGVPLPSPMGWASDAQILDYWNGNSKAQLPSTFS